MKLSVIKFRVLIIISFVCVLAILPETLFAQEVSSVKNYPTPFLLTAAGQSPDVLMVKIVSTKNMLDFAYEPLAGVDGLAGKKTLLLVMGVSMKGLGSAGIDMDEEMDRIDALINKARKDGISIIGMFAGGAGGRGGRDELTDSVISKVAPQVDYLVVIKSGDRDGYLKSIAEENNIALTYMNTIMDMTKIVPQIFQ